MRYFAEVAAFLVLLVVSAGSYYLMQFFVRGQIVEGLAVVIGAVAFVFARRRMKCDR